MMNIADRIQALRKARGISQEELADRVGVSRQAVSKWEGEQSTPDLDKVLLLSDYFQVSTDYLLKGIEPPPSAGGDTRLGSRILYIASVGFIFIGLFLGLGGWYEEQSLSNVVGGAVIQAVGVAAYFIGRAISAEKPGLWVKLLDLLGMAFMPASMAVGALLRQMAAPYPIGLFHWMVFLALYAAIGAAGFAVLKRDR